LMTYSKRVHAALFGIESYGWTLEEMMRNFGVVLAFGEATDGIHLLERTVVLPIDTDRTDGARSLSSRMERRSCRRHEERPWKRGCSSRTSTLEVFRTYQMCAFGHPKFRDWFAAAFEFFDVLYRTGNVTNGFMADVAAEDKVKRLKRLRQVSFGSHHARV